MLSNRTDGDGRRFLNLSTTKTIEVDLLVLLWHKTLTSPPAGLLILLDEYNHIQLLNPLTRLIIELPPVTTLLSSDHHYDLFNGQILAWGSFIVPDPVSFVLCFPSLGRLGIAKPGDKCWKVIQFKSSPYTTHSMFSGRFYCAIQDTLMVLETSTYPRLEVAAKLRKPIYTVTYTAHLVDRKS